MSNNVTYNRWDAGQPAYDRWMGENPWEEDSLSKEPKGPHGKILDESLPHYKFEYIVKECKFFRIRHYYNVPSDYKKNHKNHSNPIPITDFEYKGGLRWRYIEEFHQSTKKILKEFHFDQNVEQMGQGSFSTNLELEYIKGEIEVQYNFLSIADQLIIATDEGVLLNTPMESTLEYRTIRRKFDFKSLKTLFISITHEADTLPADTIWDIRINITYEIETIDNPDYKNEYSDPWDFLLNFMQICSNINHKKIHVQLKK